MESDDDFARRVHGLFVGQLTIPELERLRPLRLSGQVWIEYLGTSGLLGLGKIVCSSIRGDK